MRANPKGFLKPLGFCRPEFKSAPEERFFFEVGNGLTRAADWTIIGGHSTWPTGERNPWIILFKQTTFACITWLILAMGQPWY
jgi:hypothetical protein